MLKELYGYNVSEVELQEYLVGLTLPEMNVEIKKQNDLFEVYCNGTLLYFSELEVKAVEEKERLEDCWLLEQAQKYFTDKKIVLEQENEPLPVLTDRELIEQILDIQIEQALNAEYLACLKELGI